MLNKDSFERICARIDSYRQDMIDLQIGLCAIPAIGPDNGGDGELLKSIFLKEQLLALGFENFRHYDAPDNKVSSGIRPNFITTIKGKNETRFTWIITHLDIVPPGEIKLWSHDPYRAYVKNGRIYGRGMEDNQQDMVASIFAAKAILDEGPATQNSIGLGFVADEETSGQKGLHYMLSADDSLFHPEDLIIIPDSGNPEGSLIEVAEKSMLWLSFATKGVQCHASNPQLGNNAFVAASHLVTQLSQLKIIFSASDPLYNPPSSTFEPTKKEANVGNINTIPGEDVFYMDCRVLPEYQLEDVISSVDKIVKQVEKEFKVTIEVKPVTYLQAPPPTSPDSPVVLSIKQAVSDVYGINASAGGVGAGTLAAYFRKRNYPAAVWSKINQSAHQPDENCCVDNMVGNAKVFAHIFLQN